MWNTTKKQSKNIKLLNWVTKKPLLLEYSLPQPKLLDQILDQTALFELDLPDACDSQNVTVTDVNTVRAVDLIRDMQEICTVWIKIWFNWTSSIVSKNRSIGWLAE